MPETSDRLPWYLDFTKLFIGAGVIGAVTLGWFASGQPGLPPQDGDYSCLEASSFQNWERAEDQGAPYVFDPREDQYGVTLKSGSIVDARVYPGSLDFTAPPESRSASSYSFGSKRSPTTFTATVDGSRVGCFRS